MKHRRGRRTCQAGLGSAAATGFLSLARATGRHPGLVILLDEFPYLADAEPALPSMIQKFWDSGAAQVGSETPALRAPLAALTAPGGKSRVVGRDALSMG